MLTAVRGTYENGQIIWEETPPVQKRTEVIVTFLDEEPVAEKKDAKLAHWRVADRCLQILTIPWMI